MTVSTCWIQAMHDLPIFMVPTHTEEEEVNIQLSKEELLASSQQLSSI